jgi:glycosyltransferase involved in cell wall biosynthesis
MTGSDNSLEISVFVYSFAGGGAEKMMMKISNELHHRGHNIELIVAKSKGPMKSCLNNNIDINYINGRNSFDTILSLYNYTREANMDVLFSTLEIPNISSVLTAKILYSTPVVLRCANIYSNRERSGKYKIIPLLKRLTYPKSDSIISISNGVFIDISQTVRDIPEGSSIIHNPAYDSSINKKCRDPVDHDWLNDDNKKVIISVGNLKPQKDYPTMLRCISELQDKSEMYLVILGKGKQKENLMKLADELGIQDRISFEGFVNNPYSYMSKADVFALSSEWEGFGNVIVEAMACGTPVVCTDCPGGASEILNDGKYGSLVPVGDEEALASAIWEMLNNPTDSSTLKSRAKDFDVRHIVDQYERVFNSVVE